MKVTTHYILLLVTYHILLAIVLATIVVACCNGERAIALISMAALSILKLMWWLVSFEDDCGGAHFAEDDDE